VSFPRKLNFHGPLFNKKRETDRFADLENLTLSNGRLTSSAQRLLLVLKELKLGLLKACKTQRR